jgi:hypothetical protein
MGRRTFVLGAGAAVLSLRIPGRAVAADRAAPALVLAPVRGTPPAPSGLGILDLEAETHRQIEAGFVGHSVVGNPARPRRVVLVGQRPGKRSCEIDLDDGAVTQVIDSGSGRYFYGHGAYSEDGTLFYATENDVETGAGLVTVRDAATFKVLGEFPTHGADPHEMRPLGDGTTFVVCNGGITTGEGPPERRPSLCYVDAASGKLLSRDTLPRGDRSIRHLAVTDRNDVALALRADDEQSPSTAVALRWHGGPLTEMTEPAEVAGQAAFLALSVAIHEGRGIAGFTHPQGNLVTFWSMREQRFLRALPMDQPQGITVTADARHFLVSSLDGALRLVDATSLEPRPLDVRGLNWKHSLTWRVPAA